MNVDRKDNPDLDVRSAGDVSRLLFEMFGLDPGPMRGVIHVTAVAGDHEPKNVLRIGPQTPQSPYDAFVLSVARARANVIVTTGRIVREEPELTHDYIGTRQLRSALDEWRREFVGFPDPVSIFVLTSGKDLDPAHPVFSGPRPVTIYTSKEGADRLRKQSLQCDVVASENPTIRTVIDFALTTRGAATVSIEAGPSTTPPLYELPLAVDELLLSIFHGTVAPALLGGAFITRQRLRHLFHSLSSHRIRDPDGDWSFHRFVR